MRLTRFAAAVVLAVVAQPAFADDTIPNPEFASWSKHKKGTSVTLKTVSEVAGMKSEIVMTNTLVDVGDDKLVIETATSFKVNGMDIKSPAQKRDVTKTITLPKGMTKEDVTKIKPEGTTEEGTETLKVSGIEVKTKWYKYKSEVAGTKTEAQMWTSDDMPGMIVKSVTKTTGAAAATITMEVTEFKKP